MIRYLTQDIVSHTNRSTVYGRYGDKVTVVTDSIDVKIVEGADGKRFSVKDEYLSLTPVIESTTASENKVKTEDKPIKKTVVKTSNKPLTMVEKLQLEFLNK